MTTTSSEDPEESRREHACNGGQEDVWFTLDPRQLFAFSGLWTSWRGERGPKSAPTVSGEHLAYDHLKCEPNRVVAPVHNEAIPTEEEYHFWMGAPWDEAKPLQRRLRDSVLRSSRVAQTGGPN